MIGEVPEKQSATSEAHDDELPRLILHNEDSLMRLLRFGQRLLVQNPEAARTIIQAIVAEGRRFAQTPDGQRRKEVLTKSELVRRGRLIWQAYGLDSLLDTMPGLVPSDWLEYMIDELEKADMEELLSQLMIEGAWHGTIGSL